MGRSAPLRAGLGVALLVSLSLGSAGAPAQGSELVANPALLRDLPPPGWLVNHPEEWIAAHPVYQATCASPDVVQEIRFLNRVVSQDEYLLARASQQGSSDLKVVQQVKIAASMVGLLRGDVARADALVLKLQALPACDAAASAPAAAAPPAEPAQPVATDTAAPEATPMAAASTEQAAAPSPAPAAAADEPPLVVVRFDDRIAALTPGGIRAFADATALARAGQPVRIAIAGCAAADFTAGSVCVRRRMSLAHRLAEQGVRDPKRLFAAAPQPADQATTETPKQP